MINELLRGNSAFAQFFRYVFVAGIGLVFDFSTVIISKQVLHIYYLLAAVMGFIIGLTITYVLSNLVVFGKPAGDQRKIFLLFALIGVVGLGLLTLFMWILTGLLDINYIAAKGMATIVVFAWNFLARKSLYKQDAGQLPYEL